jgi:uncharacterized Zn finger protein
MAEHFALMCRVCGQTGDILVFQYRDVLTIQCPNCGIEEDLVPEGKYKET